MRLYFSLKSAQRLRPVHGEKRRTIPYRAIVLSVRERNLFMLTLCIILIMMHKK